MRLGSLVLAGGRSTRMGRPKEALPFHGETLLARTVATLSRCTDTVVVAARREQVLPPLPHPVERVDDEGENGGPLAAIAGGLRCLRDRHACGDHDAVFVAACDMPFLSCDVVRLLQHLAVDAQLTIPRVAGVLQPLCAIWRLDTEPAIDALLRNGVLALQRVADVVTTRVVDEDRLRTVDPRLRAFANVNSPDDYARSLADRSS